MNKSQQKTRRHFLQTGSAFIGAALAVPTLIPSSALGNQHTAAPSERIVMGFIGMGTMGEGHVFDRAWTYMPGGYIGRKDVQVAAICDVWKQKREKYAHMVDAYYTQHRGQAHDKPCKAFPDFRDLLDWDMIDAVLIATPIHWHAIMAVMAAQAGKDVYCEKPTAGTIHESQAMVKIFTQNKRVFQAGTQQRSEYEGKFRKACEYIRNGRIGAVKEIYAFRDGGGVMWPQQVGEVKPIPDGLDWDLWLGPAPKIPYQGRADAHYFGFGGINWGQHHYDIVQWALNADRTGPVEVFYDEGHAAYRYANGVVVYGRPYPGSQISETGGAWFIGTKGKIAVDRTHLISDPPDILQKPLGPDAERVYHSDSHSGNFLECIKTRKRTICDIQTAHRAASVMLLGGIAIRLKRNLTWDPKIERFIGDDEANRYLSLAKRDPWIV
ncbi:gfo/Idh/MocA family oxidoreductase [bacterium]|nr:gfo/Idh/MocA family oxidoreductase [bacterium]